VVVETRRQQGNVTAVVRDRGVGRDQTPPSGAFEPLFRGHRFARDATSSGLGLSIARELVAQHGGRLEIDSSPGSGTSVRLVLPAAAPPKAAARVEDSERPAVGDARRARLLVVDDEPAILRAYQRMLARDCEITCAGGGREALEALAERRDFDLVLSDLSMPEVSGMELYRRATTAWPELERAFVFVTGATGLPEVQSFAERHRDRVLEKPVAGAAIFRLIDRARRV
jgi:CheY-like chemotaxis protein